MWDLSSSGDMEARRGSSIALLPSRASCRAEPSDCVRPAIARADPNRLLDGEHENLAVADAARAGGIFDRFDRALGQVVLDHHLDLHLGEEVDNIFGAAIELRVPLLPPEALHLGHGNARNADLVQGVLHIVELERLNDRLDLLHARLPFFGNDMPGTGKKRHGPMLQCGESNRLAKSMPQLAGSWRAI